MAKIYFMDLFFNFNYEAILDVLVVQKGTFLSQSFFYGYKEKSFMLFALLKSVLGKVTIH